MNHRPQIIVLCEDSQHEAFARRYLKRAGWENRQIRVRRSPPGRGGSAEQFVRETYPTEVKVHRSNRDRVNCALLVIIDGDNLGPQGRLAELDAACVKANVEMRRQDERIAVIVPTWNIETWCAYLNGGDVDERRADSPRLDRERDCDPCVKVLHEMCQQQSTERPQPPSLKAACAEFQKRILTQDR